MIASNEEFLMTVNFDLSSSNSKEPSSTIKINPIVPNTGSIGVKFGIVMLKKTAACFTLHPKMSSRITDGIFVLDELISKR